MLYHIEKYSWVPSFFFSIGNSLEVINHFSLFSHNESAGIQMMGANISLVGLKFKGLGTEVLFFLG